MPRIRFQDWLDRMDRTLFEDDFEGYADGISLPLALTTQSTTRLIENRDTLHIGFVAWRDMLRALKVTDVIRTSRDVEELGDDLVQGRYETRILRGTVHAVPPFVSAMTLRQQDGVWRAVSVVSGMANSEFPINLPVVPTDQRGAPGGPA